MTKKIENATGLYLEGIRDGNMQEALDKYVGDRYTQHSTGVADGKEGFLAFFAPFLERTPVRDIQVVRAIEDGSYVFCHVYQSLNNGEAKWITADLFNTDDEDRLVEHWDVIAAYEESDINPNTPVDGATEVIDLDKTEINKKIIRNFITDILQKGRAEKISEYISSDQYIQHNQSAGDGIDGILARMNWMAENKITATYDDIFKIIGQGNFVVSYCKVTINGVPHAVFDLFRIEDGLIVEHWDNQEIIPPREEWKNSGKF